LKPSKFKQQKGDKMKIRINGNFEKVMQVCKKGGKHKFYCIDNEQNRADVNDDADEIVAYFDPKYVRSIRLSHDRYTETNDFEILDSVM